MRVTTVESGDGRSPASSGVLEPYTEPDPYFIGPLQEAIERQNQILAAGRFTTPPQLHPLPDGRVLLVTEVMPNQDGQRQRDNSGGRFAQWSPILLAGGTVLLVIVAAVLLFLFAIGLYALVKWGIANALTIGSVLAFAAFAGMLFLVVLARARNAGHHHGGYYR